MILFNILLLAAQFSNIDSFSIGYKDIKFEELTQISNFSKKNLQSNQNTGKFYFVQIKNRTELNLKILEPFPNVFVPKNCISPPNLFKAFLQPEEFEQLSKFNFISIFNVPQNVKISNHTKSKTTKIENSNSSNFRFLIEATSEFPQLFKNYGEISHLIDDLYSFTIHQSFRSNNTNYLNHITNLLQSSDDVFSYDAWPRLRKNNRYGVGYIQTNKYLLEYDQNCDLVRSFAPLARLGYTGSDYIVTISDSGLDPNSPWLIDSSENYPYNINNEMHRKVVRYETFSSGSETDKTDASGHGTHVVTTLLGQSIDNDYSSLYNGIAPNAKAYFIDLENGIGDMYGDSRMSEHIQTMKSFNSHISSNSWGYEIPSTAQNALYNRLAVNNPEILFVFAAGNEYSYVSVTSPAGAKNVLTVGALDSLDTTTLISNQKGRLTFEVSINGIKDKSISCKSLNTFDTGSDITSFGFKQVAPEMFKSNPSGIFNVDCVSYSDATPSYLNKAVVVSTCDELDNALLKGATYIITQDLSSIESCSTSSQQRAYGFEINSPNIVDNKLTITPQLKSITQPIPNISIYSSKGPSTYGAIKPEIAGPGTYIISSGIGGKILDEQSGTSMATPLVSGALTILMEYLSRHPSLFSKSKSQAMNSHLIKAIAIASADKKDPKVPDFESGFGSLNLANAIPELQIEINAATSSSSARILSNSSKHISSATSNMEFFNGLQLEPMSTYVYSFNVKSASFDVRVVFSYLDQAAATSDTLNVKAHLNVETPTKKLLFPLGDTVEDYTSTVSRIYIPKEELTTGQYKIIITTSEAFFADTAPYKSINGSLVVIGDIDSLTDISTQSNSFDWSIYCNSKNSVQTSSSNFHSCICDQDSHGLICQDRSVYHQNDVRLSVTMKPFETKYFYQIMEEKVSKLSFIWSQSYIQGNYIMFHGNPGSRASQLTFYQYYYASEKPSVSAYISCVSADGSYLYSKGTRFYYAFTNYGPNTIVLNVTNSMDLSGSSPGSVGQIAFVIFSFILIFAVIIIIITITCIRRRKKVMAEMNSTTEESAEEIHDVRRNARSNGGNVHISIDPNIAQNNNAAFYAPPPPNNVDTNVYMNPAYRPNSRFHDENEEDSLYRVYRRSEYNLAYNNSANNNENQEQDSSFYPAPVNNNDQAPQYYPPTTNFENQQYPNQNNNENPMYSSSPHSIYIDPFKLG